MQQIFVLLGSTFLAFAVARVVDFYAAGIGTSKLLMIVRMCICALPASIAFVGLAYILKVDEMRQILKFLKK